MRREGRRNRYTIVPGQYLSHPSQRTIPVQALLDLFDQAAALGTSGGIAGTPTVEHVTGQP
ncbi:MULTISPECIES: hypothetical protein [unclassified Nonomuraea]|uniref:hypothetical protein n=1 Tax=unclassified Nonomuraea TaxID=2593643 RepID=UPI0033D5239F